LKTIEIGRVLKPHGLGGEVKVRLHWSGSRALSAVKSVLLVQDGAADMEFAVEGVRGSSQAPLLKLAGVGDRDQAAALSGARLSVARDALPELEAGEYYLVDLVGALVVGPEGPLGEVIEVRTHPSVDCVAIRLSDGRVAEQPLSEPWVREVDASAGRITLKSVDGLIL
jgi:16S rRNA processing protein RimM